MKGKKNKPANIIKKSIEVVHSCDIGTQPHMNKKDMLKPKKKKLPMNKDLFVMNSTTSSKRRSQKRKTKKPKVYKLLEANDNIDITSMSYKRKNKMEKYKSIIKKIR